MSAAADARSKSPSVPLDAAPAPAGSMEDDAPEFSTTPAADLVGSGIGGLAIALGLCPEAAQSGKRTKMIHKKGEVQVANTPLVLKWNVDYKAGAVVNLRVVTLKPATSGAPAEELAGSATDGETSAAPAAGVKRKRKEAKRKKNARTQAG